MVHSAELDYTETSDPGLDLDRLTYETDGYMDEVHTWRNDYGVDFICLYMNRNDIGGIGWLLTDPNGRANRAFCIARVQQSDWTYTVVHEWGHNMGCSHSKTQVIQPWENAYNLTSYSAGWQWPDSQSSYDGYCTVMTYMDFDYDGVYEYSRVPYFSNPNISYAGNSINPTGHVQDGDNARAMQEIKDVLAGYRATVVDPPPPPPPPPLVPTTNYNYSLNFENGFGGWSTNGGDFSWTLNQGGTPTLRTGPSEATNESWYVYTEADDHLGQTAWLSKEFDFSDAVEMDLEFFYHMYGSKMGTLVVSISTNGGAQWTDFPTISGNEDVWQSWFWPLDDYCGMPSVTLRFVGTVGSGTRSDMALDLIAVTGRVAIVEGDRDSDDDGLPDEWEEQYFGGSTSAVPDSVAANGVNTLLESYIIGLDPTDPDALFTATPLDGNVIEWTAVSGRVYSIYGATNLFDGFLPLETNIFWPQSSWTDLVPRVDSFYRIDVQLAE